MEINQLIQRFSKGAENQKKAIFSTLFIAGNRLQTLFDKRIPKVSLKQFMLLSVVRQSGEPLTLTQLGNLLGCSRQNVKKLADALMKKGFVTVLQPPGDTRAVRIAPTEQADCYFQKEFSNYQEELNYLFDVYTEDEIQALFRLLSKMYAGIENLEQHVKQEAANTNLN